MTEPNSSNNMSPGDQIRKLSMTSEVKEALAGLADLASRSGDKNLRSDAQTLATDLKAEVDEAGARIKAGKKPDSPYVAHDVVAIVEDLNKNSRTSGPDAPGYKEIMAIEKNGTGEYGVNAKDLTDTVFNELKVMGAGGKDKGIAEFNLTAELAGATRQAVEESITGAGGVHPDSTPATHTTLHTLLLR